MWNSSATLSCGILLLSVGGLPNPSSATGLKLQRAHPLFGKCTASDLGGAVASGEISFLQGETSPPSDEECLQLLADEKVLIHAVLNTPDEDTEEAEPLITEASSPEEVISRAAELLKDDPATDSTHSKAILKKIWSLLSNAARESTLFVLGLGPELFAFAKLAKNVIAVETDDVFCQQFLKSKAGSCAMQSNVHIYCTRSTASQEIAESGASQLEEAGSVGDALMEPKDNARSAMELAQGDGPHKLLHACKLLLDDLVAQQFGDVPISALVVLGRYPVAKLLLMQEFLDQSTVIFARSRMTSRGLAALSGSMRVLANFGAGRHSTSQSTESIFLFQRIFSLTKRGDLWMNYTASPWELPDDKAPLQLLDEAREAIRSNVSAAGASQAKRDALDGYLNVYGQVSRRGTDEERQATKQSLEDLRRSAANGDTFDSVLAVTREFAVKAAQETAASAGLREYVKLLWDSLAKQDKQQEPLIHAVTCELIVDASNAIASPNVLEQLKDGIEEACELAESRPQMFLPALRLLYGCLMEEDCIGEVVRILMRLKKLGPEVDLSALTRQTEL